MIGSINDPVRRGRVPEGEAVTQILRFASCVVTFLAASIALPAFAQHDAHGGAAVPEEILSRPITRHEGVGHMHQKVSTTSVQAQAFYDQGLAYLHSYVWIDAARSFHQALRSDPHLGMAYVALADAYLGLQDVASARSACMQAKALEKYMNAYERAWLSIREAEVAYAEDTSDVRRYGAYRKALDDAMQAYPRDPWLLVQRGLAVEGTPFTHGQASGAESLTFYKKALQIDPGNLAAFHYAIHANENLGNIKDALPESAEYARLAYAIPHAHHMHGHELMRMGRTEEAIKEFIATDELEQRYYKTENIPVQYDWHHAHNLQLLALNYEVLGQMKSAEKLLREAFALPASTDFLAYNRRAWPEFLLGRRRFDEALAASQEMVQSQWPMARIAGHALAGEADLGLNRIDDAQHELVLAQQDARQIPANVASALPYPAMLQAAILLRENRVQEGEGLYVKIEQGMMAMRGPDGWIGAIFALESIARDARDAGDWDLAQYTAQQMMQHDPHYAGSHYAFGLVAEHAGETDGSREMFTEAERLWAHADDDLAELVFARKQLLQPHSGTAQ